MGDNNKHNAKLGLFILTGLVIFIVGILAIGNINNAFKKSIQVFAVFEEVNGLQVGDNVWLSGVKVGTVKDMQFLSNSDVLININIEQKIQQYIPKNALAKISSDGLIGNKLIVIYSGDLRSGTLQTNDTLHVESSITNEDMMATLQQNNTNLLAITTDFKNISKQILEGKGTVGKLIADEQLYTNLTSAMAEINTTAGKLNSMSSSLDQFTQKLNSPGNLANNIVTDTSIFKDVEMIVSNLTAVSNQVLQTSNELKILTTNLNSNNTSVAGVLLNDENAALNLQQSLINLESSSQKLNENMEALQHNFLFRRYFKKENNK
jgi:phospholipid/cholesterol/gamma-HCH transport system substrate-binding protein